MRRDRSQPPAQSPPPPEASRSVVLDDEATFDALEGADLDVPGDEPEDGGETPDAIDVEVPEPEERAREPEWRKTLQNAPNEAGVVYDKERDDCFHLNATWKGGVCTVQGNAPCPFLGGNQGKCQYHVERAAETERRRHLPPSERYKLDVV